jgi:hypothetical protein
MLDLCVSTCIEMEGKDDPAVLEVLQTMQACWRYMRQEPHSCTRRWHQLWLPWRTIPICTLSAVVTFLCARHALRYLRSDLHSMADHYIA